MKLGYGDPEQVGMSGERISRLRELARSWVAQGMTPALVVLVARKGVIVLHEAFGTLTHEPDSPPLPRDAIFPLASISKPFTATAAMILVDDGLLGLNRPVQEYIPEFVGDGKEVVMVHHLLTHTSGLRDEAINRHLERKVETSASTTADVDHPAMAEFPFIQYFSQAHDAPLDYRPGAEMSYCNHGYGLLSEVIRRVADQSLGAFARDRIFGPMGMLDSSYGLPDNLGIRAVRRGPDAPLAILDNFPLVHHFSGAGAVFSTASDLAVFGTMTLNRGSYGAARILSRAAVNEMTRNQTVGVPATYNGEIFPESSWGLGWSVQGTKRGLRTASLLSPKAVSHGGAGGVFFWIDPDSDLVGAYLSVNRFGPGEIEESHDWRADLFANAATAAIDEI